MGVFQPQPYFTHGIAIKPTGWSKKVNIRSFNNNPHVLIEVPYSEHSSYDELVAFVQRVPFKVLVPTVGRVGVGLSVVINEGSGMKRHVQKVSAQTAQSLLQHCGE